MMEYVGVVVLLALCTLVGTIVLPFLSVTDIAMLFLACVALAASRVRRGAALFAAFLSIALFDFFFVPPRFTFAVADLHYVLTFVVMLGCALTISELAVRLRYYGDAALERERRNAGLYAMSQELVPTLSLDELVAVITRHVQEAFDADVLVLLRGPEGALRFPGGTATFPLDEQERATAQAAFDHWRTAGAAAGHVPAGRPLFVPLVGSTGRFGVLAVRPKITGGRQADATIRNVLETYAGQAAVALERARAFQLEGARTAQGG